jgi:hypothetical protein
MNVAVGKLTFWNSGNGGGTIQIVESSGATMTFTEGAAITVNGTTVDCYSAPQGTSTPNPSLCKNWPTELQLGSTKVVVFYWSTTDASGQSCNVTNRLLAGTAALPTITALKRKHKSL